MSLDVSALGSFLSVLPDTTAFAVILGLDPRIQAVALHASKSGEPPRQKNVDPRVKPGDDGRWGGGDVRQDRGG